MATLIVYDRNGGYAKSSLKVTTDPNGMEFSGFVSGTDTPALAGAVVEIGGQTAVTDSSGFFSMRMNDRKRFVMNIRKPGYGFASNIYYDSVIGGRWQLTRASVFHVDPRTDLDLQNKRAGSECPGPQSSRLNWKGNRALAMPQFQDGRGNIVPRPKGASWLPGLAGGEDEQKKQHPDQQKNSGCPPGVHVKFKANSFVDSRGRAPMGLVDVQLSTVDLQSGQMPGNYTVLRASKLVGVMQSYGAGVIEISSGATKYNLRSGMTATLIIPVDRAQLASGSSLPATIPLLSYDEVRAVWKEEGTATLQTVAGQRSYVAEISHLTAYNSDLIKVDQACVAVQNQGMPASYDLEWTIPVSGGPPVVVTRTVVGGNTETALLNLPKQTNITLVPIRTGDPDPLRNNLPIGVFTVNTGEPQNPAWPTVPGGFQNEPQGPPYYHETGGVPDGACSTKVVLTDRGLAFYPGTPNSGAFLHGLGIGSFAAVNLTVVGSIDGDPNFPDDTNQTLRDAVTAASADYRATIDPRGLRPTLSCFKVVNRMPLRAGESCPQHTGSGFVPQPALTETTAAYANTVDLGFGREMHCVQDGASAACYVSNYDQNPYTGPGQGPDTTKAQHAVEGLNGLRVPDATVTMEFSQIEDTAPNGSPVTLGDPDRVVKFYVFNAVGNPADAADLDGLGARPVPQLCMVCHGGQIPNASGTTSTSAGVATPVFRDGDPTTDDRPNVKLGARFLPFDLQSFTYVAPDSDTGNPFTRLNQQAAFKRLNEIAKSAPTPDPSDPSTNVVNALFDAWYSGGVTNQIPNAIPTPWDTDNLHRGAYVNVVAKSCRTCHVANLATNLRFDQPGASGFDSQLGRIQSAVCLDHVMPHARRTHDLFWTSVNLSQPAQLQAFGDTIHAFGWQNVNDPVVSDSLACGGNDEFGNRTFTQGGGALSAPTGFTDAQTVLSTCTGCHNAANAAAGTTFARLNLEPALAYSQIVGVNSLELPTFKRVVFGATTETSSYLWRKISATHTGLGTYVLPGPGVAMPQGSTGLLNINPTAANTIRAWIANGAPP
jgi:cytochrome c5